MKHKHTSDYALADLAPNDEVGTPSDQIEKCTCGVLFRVGSWHICEHVNERVSWNRYQSRQENH